MPASSSRVTRSGVGCHGHACVCVCAEGNQDDPSHAIDCVPRSRDNTPRRVTSGSRLASRAFVPWSPDVGHGSRSVGRHLACARRGVAWLPLEGTTQGLWRGVWCVTIRELPTENERCVTTPLVISCSQVPQQPQDPVPLPRWRPPPTCTARCSVYDDAVKLVLLDGDFALLRSSLPSPPPTALPSPLLSLQLSRLPTPSPPIPPPQPTAILSPLPPPLPNLLPPLPLSPLPPVAVMQYVLVAVIAGTAPQPDGGGCFTDAFAAILDRSHSTTARKPR